MLNLEEFLGEKNDVLEEPHLPFTQMIANGVDIEAASDPNKFFDFPVSCRFPYCKAILDSEIDLKSHQSECHGGKKSNVAYSCLVCSANKSKGAPLRRRSFVVVNGFKKHLTVQHPGPKKLKRARCPTCGHVVKKDGGNSSKAKKI